MAESILSRIADHEGVEPETLDPPLYRVIDPEALEELFRDTTGRVAFSYHGYDVTVDDEGFVVVADGREE